MTQTFEEMGRIADRARVSHARAKAHLIDIGNRGGEAAMTAMVDVTIKGASWDNGMLDFQVALRSVIGARAAELMPEALALMEADSKRAVAMLGGAINVAGEAQIPAPVVPRQDADGRIGPASSETLPPAPLVPLAADTITPEMRAVFEGLSKPAVELLRWIAGHQGQRLAKTTERTELQDKGIVTCIGTSPNQTWNLTEPGQKLASLA